MNGIDILIERQLSQEEIALGLDEWCGKQCGNSVVVICKEYPVSPHGDDVCLIAVLSEVQGSVSQMIELFFLNGCCECVPENELINWFSKFFNVTLYFPSISDNPYEFIKVRPDEGACVSFLLPECIDKNGVYSFTGCASESIVST